MPVPFPERFRRHTGLGSARPPPGRARRRQDMVLAGYGAGNAHSTWSRQGTEQAEPGAPRHVQGSGRRAAPASGQASD